MVAGLVVAAGTAALCPVAAQTNLAAEAITLTALPTSSLTIRGSTTIGARWHCTARDIVATAVLNAEPRAFSFHAIRTVFVTVPVWTLVCQSGAMERAMRKALKADRDSSSAIVGRFSAHPGHLALHADTGAAAHLDGALTVAGVARVVRLDVLLELNGDGTVRAGSALPLELSLFSITPPRVLFGAVRARDAITIHVDLLFPGASRDP